MVEARDNGFGWLLAGQNAAWFGSQVASVALPLTAVIVLGLSPVQMGILGAATTAPQLVVGLLAGVWTDRYPKRAMLILTDVGRSVLLASIPLAALGGILTFEWLYVTAFLAGCMTVLSDVAYLSYIPAIVRRDGLLHANSRVEQSASVWQMVGPAVGGFLVQSLTAPIAVAVTAVMHLVSAAFFAKTRPAKDGTATAQTRPGTFAGIRGGLAYVFQHPVLVPIMGCGATHNFSSSAIRAILVLFFVNELGLSATTIGIVFAAAGVGALFGALVANSFTRRFGIGSALASSQFLTGIGLLIVPLVAGTLFVVTAVLILGFFLQGLSRPIFNISQVSLRQKITPDEMLGRMNATIRFVMWGIAPFGALAGGFLGEAIGLREAMLLLVTFEFAAVLWIVLSPVRKLHGPTTAA